LAVNVELCPLQIAEAEAVGAVAQGVTAVVRLDTVIVLCIDVTQPLDSNSYLIVFCQFTNHAHAVNAILNTAWFCQFIVGFIGVVLLLINTFSFVVWRPL
jgi:hypothetical protein